jgi:broad specificity phosphatase PhoE
MRQHVSTTKGNLMEILFIRHAESLWNTKVTEDLDSDLSDLGRTSSLATAQWLKQNFDFKGYIGLVSPYLRTLRTARDIADQCGVKFEIDCLARENHVGDGGPKESIAIPFRNKEFPDFDWAEMKYEFAIDENQFFFNNRDVAKFVYDCELFLDALRMSDDNFVVVSHAVPIKVMVDIATGMDVVKMVKEYTEDWTRMCKQIKNNSLTWIKDGKAEWMSKVVC